MKISQILGKVTLGLLPVQAVARALGGKPSDFIIAERAPLQDIVTWDEHSLFVHGERIIFWGGEVHPFRSVDSLKTVGLDTLTTQAPCSVPLVRHFPENQSSRVQWSVNLHALGSS